jgi:hypothetical protein
MARFTCTLALFTVTLCLTGALRAQDLFRSVVTAETLDLANTAEFPAPPDPLKGSFPHTPSRREGLLGMLHIQGAMSPHASWTTGETAEHQRYLRLAFTKALPIGTLLGGGGTVSYLKADAPFPGDVTNEAHWTAVPLSAGQAGLRVHPFPPGVQTRALRFSFTDPLPNGGASRSGFGGLLVLSARLHNLTPEAVPFASSQVTGAPNVVEATRVHNLITGGSWTGAQSQDLSPAHPAWVILAWPTAQRLAGLGVLDAFAKRLEIDALAPDATGHPAAAAEKAWTPVATLAPPVWWRPAYTDAYVPFAQPVTTRAVRLRITEPLTTENADVARVAGGGRRTVSLGGVMTFTALDAAPVPPRPAAVPAQPPIAISLTMPVAGKLAIAIDDAQGRRVRNLVAEVDRAAGAVKEFWDGTDDQGRLVPPGVYTWKGLTHAPLHLTYHGTVNCSGTPPWWKSGSWNDQFGAGSWLSDHATPHAVTAIGERVFIGAEIAESGHTILACDLDGKKVWGTKWLETAGAGFLTNDGQKVYSAGEGGWIGERLYLHEIDPQTCKWRRVTQLVYDSGPTPTGGVTGIAARGGKLYVAFNRPAPSWLSSGIATAAVDPAHTTTKELEWLFTLLRTKGTVPPHAEWKTASATTPTQHLRLAFKTPQPVGSFLTPATVEISALRPEAAYPGVLEDDAQWLPFASAPAGAVRVATAPPAVTTRALRFTFRAPGDGKAWTGMLPGGLLLSHRMTDVTAGATLQADAGDVRGLSWTLKRDRAISPEAPATVRIVWPEAKRLRGLGFVGLFAKRVAIEALEGEGDPATAPEARWTRLGELSPAIRWRVNYSDDYFDAGRVVTTRALRLRVLEPWVAENTDIASTTGSTATYAAVQGLVVLAPSGDDPALTAPPSQRISVVDIATGRWERDLAVPTPRFPTFDPQGNLYLVTGERVARLNLIDGTLTPLPTPGLKTPRGLAFDPQGTLFAADGADEVVKVYSPAGGLLRVIGRPGGRVVGAYEPRRIANPQGIAVDARGQLWVTERDYQPKRTSLWKADGTFVNEFIGPAQYGGGGFVDPKDPGRFFYGGMEFALTAQTGAWAVKRVLTRTQAAFSGGRVDHPVYLNGRQYMVNDPSAMEGHLLLVGERQGEGVIPRTAVGNVEEWRPFVDDPACRALLSGKVASAHSFVWADGNGDGAPHPGEITLSAPGVRLNPTYWPSRVNGRLEVVLGGRLLKPAGFTACGAPIYQPFTTPPLPKLPAENIYATAVDAAGRVLVNGRPVLAMAPDGQVAWSYPQSWVGVHDSHRAPAPKAGQLIGGLGFIGQEEVPNLGEAVMLSGNKGEWYLFSNDGMLAATLWTDYRTPGAISWHFPTATHGMSLDKVTLGEEHFGGGFTKTTDGRYFLVAGHNHNSVAALTGLDTFRRQGGTLTLTPQLVTTCERWLATQAMAQAQRETPRVLTATAPTAPVVPDGKLAEWPAERFTPIGSRGAAAIAVDATNLYLAFRVESGGLPRNGGDDPKLLFKTGDSVDLQLGVDAAASPTRMTPVPGDQRLLLTLQGGKPVGVLYQHRVPGTAPAAKTPFTSPWRTEYVDRIQTLDAKAIGIARTPTGYAVEAVVPLSLLGFTPTAGAHYRVDFGILSADGTGAATQVRTYWANPAVGIVSDTPSEIQLVPGLWGEMTVE